MSDTALAPCTQRKPIWPVRLILLAPVRLVCTILGLVVIALHILWRQNSDIMAWICAHIVRPWHRFGSRVCSFVPWSVAGVLLTVIVLSFLAYLVFCIYSMIQNRRFYVVLYRLVLTAAMLVAVIYALFCLLWGAYYYTSDFEQQSGIVAELVDTDSLYDVTVYFATLANTYGEQVQRDEQLCFAEPLDGIFDRSATLYDQVERSVPCLAGDALRAKPFQYSEILSRITFTGFFFPFTGEANINVKSPACLIPSTIAHELAHQRGVAAEDEANFVAVLASLESGDVVYSYSASLLAYIHLGNALHKADRDRWETVYSSLSDGVHADLTYNNTYWAQYHDTVTSKASDTVYEGFLHSYDQQLGLQTYGACVDLLVTYYADPAHQVVPSNYI